MKTSGIPIFIAFLLISLTSLSNEEIIKLNVEKGKTYVFEIKSVTTAFDIPGNPNILSKGKSKIQFEIENFDGKTLIYTSKTTSGEYENPDSKIKTIMNLEFPSIVNDVNASFNPTSVVIQFLSMTGLRCKVDLETNKVEVLNLQETIDEVKKLMEARGFNEDFIAKGIDFVQKDTTWIRKGTLKAHQFIFNFNQSIKTDNKILKSKVDGIKYQLNENNEFVSGKEKGQPGTIFSTVTLSKTHGFSLHYYEAKHDSIDIRKRRTTTGNKITILNETEITFLDEFETGNNLFTFECTIENPKDSSITLFYLDKPYGVEYTRKVLKLDENNRVKFQTKLQAPSFLSFVSKAIKFNINFSSTFFYVEPGDTLILNFNDGTNSPPLIIQGSNATANQAIRDMQKEQLLSFDLINLTPFGNENQDIFARVDNLNRKFENFLKRNNTVLNERTFLFLKNELISSEYYHYFAFLNYYYSNRWASKAKTAQEIKAEKELVQIAEQKIRDFDIHNHYNDYGIFSRRLSTQYFHYYLNNTGRIKDSQIFRGRSSLQEEFEIGKLILGGSIYYRVLADRITSSMTNRSESFMFPATYELPNATDMMNQLISQSFNEHFSNQLKSFRDTRLNWENENYIPETLFYKPDGSQIKLKEVLKGKPTVLFIASNWGTMRYSFDDEATNNPNIRYVMIVEGNNLAEWQEYIKRTEPVAEQLFLLNNENTLNDIFLSNYMLHIVYNKRGKILGYDVGKTNYTELAKQSLEEKKQLDKSQLVSIIALLGIVLVLLIFGLIIWKWRVRQRFRREQQQRRLRELELTAIRSQMNPHFLFNSLNSVQNLVQQNKGREAHLYLADFAGLIRKVLQNSEKEEVSLAEELEMTEQYLNLEKLRFDFDFSISVEQGIDINNTMVPSMLLQPFAENAVIHGLQNKPENRKLKIEVKRNSHFLPDNVSQAGSSVIGKEENSGIVISIEDNGIGREAAAAISKTKNGKGSKLIQERLEILQEKQGEKYRLEITDLTGDETGTRVEIFIPEEN